MVAAPRCTLTSCWRSSTGLVRGSPATALLQWTGRSNCLFAVLHCIPEVRRRMGPYHPALSYHHVSLADEVADVVVNVITNTLVHIVSVGTRPYL